MSEQVHDPKDEHAFKGANTDADGGVVGRTPGAYRDAQNFRLVDNEGGGGALVKIRGERLIAGPDMPGGDTYVCIGSIFVKGHRVTFWASTQPDLYPPIIRIDGVTMAMSPMIPYLADKRLQLHAAWECGGGTVFDARSGDVPLHWDIGDMIQAYGGGPGAPDHTRRYFELLDISAHQVNPTRPVNRPLFTGFTRIGPGAGVRAGKRIYYQRFVNATGDRTPDGPPVDAVYVPFQQGEVWQSGVRPFPSADLAGPTILQQQPLGPGSGWGVKLRIRAHNIANFESIEVVCAHYEQNDGPDAVAKVEVVHRRALRFGENAVYDIVDDGTVLDAIPTDENAIRTFFIKEANSVRYVKYRVVYGGVVLGKRDIRGEYIDDNGKVYPVTKSIGKLGHADPINACYKRRFQSGERHDFGVVFWDTAGGESYVDRVAENYQLPNRRDPKTGDSLLDSDYNGLAVDTDGNIGPTYEVFDHDEAIGKSQDGQVVNIMQDGGRILGPAPAGVARIPSMPSATEVFTAPDGASYGASNDGIFLDTTVSIPRLKTSQLKPFRPVSPRDFKFGLDYKVNTGVHPDGDPRSTPVAYNPKVYGVRHHTLAMALRGLSAWPNGVQGFSCVATRPAGRVVTQAIGKWVLGQGEYPLGAVLRGRPSKQRNELHLCLPDYNAGAVNQQVWEDIGRNPGQYRIEIVSYLGFSTEQYGSVMSEILLGAGVAYSHCADMLSVARAIWDTGQINPGNNAGGVRSTVQYPLGQDHFTGPATWRNDAVNAPWGSPGAPIDIVGAREIRHDSGLRSLVVSLAQPVYNTESAGTSGNFNDAQVRAFHEPFYIVNIIQEKNADDTLGYQSLNHYQHKSSFIGEADGTRNQRLRIADESIDDFWTDRPGEERYIYVHTPQGVRRWLFIGNFWGQWATINTSLITTGQWTTPLGEVIYGLYDAVRQGPDGPWIDLIDPIIPPAGSKVEVRYYGGTVFFYGDRFTAPALGTMVDAYGVADPSSANTIPQYNGIPGLGDIGPKWPVFEESLVDKEGPQVLKTSLLPIPFSAFRYNDRYMVPFGLGVGFLARPPGLAVNYFASGGVISIRQWKVLFDCEVRAPLHLSMFDAGNNDKSYPAINYVPRPFNFLSGSSYLDNGVFANYGDPSLYPGEDQNDWVLGGIKSKQLVPSDYVVAGRRLYFRRAEFGFREEENQCNALIFSNKYGPLLQDSPGLKTFPVTNIEFIENDAGGIQRLWSDSPGNLVVFTERGVFSVLIEKSIAYSADQKDFSMFAQDNFIGTTVAITKVTGMPGSSWRTAAEGSPMSERVRTDAIAWYDGSSGYLFSRGQVMDIAKGTYRKALREAASVGGPVASVFDQESDEVWMSLGGRMLVFSASPGVMSWTGGLSYVFDDYLHAQGQTFGHRELSDFELNTDPEINGLPIEAWVKIASSLSQSERMEWVRWRSISDRPPTRVEFYDENDVLVSWADATTFGRWYVKKEAVWEHWVPRNRGDRRRLQGRVAYIKFIFGAQGEDKITGATMVVKKIK